MSIVHRRRPAVPLVVPRSSEHATARPGRGRRVVRRIVEGSHIWGELEVWPSRYGYTSYCLVVYPPGATRNERIRFRLMRSWAPLGMLLGLAAAIAAVQVLPLVAAAVIGVAFYGGGAAGLALLAGPSRHRIRTLRTCRADEGASALDGGPQADLDELFAVLHATERERCEERIDAVTFELVHGAVWRRLGSAPPSAGLIERGREIPEEHIDALRPRDG